MECTAVVCEHTEHCDDNVISHWLERESEQADDKTEGTMMKHRRRRVVDRTPATLSSKYVAELPSIDVFPQLT